MPPEATGFSFDIDGDLLAVGQPLGASGNGQRGDQSAPSSGAVRVYARAGTVWSEAGYLKESSPQQNARMGLVVAIRRNMIVTTSSANSALRVFQRVGSSWVAAPLVLPMSESHGPVLR